MGLRVMHVISALQLGGAERVAVNLAVQHARWGLRPSIVTVRNSRIPNDPVGRYFRELLQQHDIPIFEIWRASFRADLVRLPFRLARIIGQVSPDLVHSHTDVPDFVVSVARRLRPFRVARTIHSTSLWSTHKTAGRLTEGGLSEDLIIGVSDDALRSYRSLRSKYRLPESSLQRVIVNGVHVRPPEELDNVKKPYCQSNPLRIAFFGRFNRDKGLDVLIKALMAWDRGQAPPIELSVFSDAADDNTFRKQVSSLPCGLRLSPPVPNAPELMAGFDLVVMPSRVEGLGLVALEALAARTPVLATSIDGLREVLPQNWPLLVPPEDPEALLRMLSAVVEGEFDLLELGRRGYQHVRNHSIEAFSKDYLNCYIEYLDQAPACPMD